MSHNIITSVIIKGIGAYLPHKTITNHELSKIVETSDNWITSRTGIQERRVAEKNEFTSHMATAAALNALQNANMAPNDIDLIIVATLTPDMNFPSTACLVQRNLNLNNIPCFDLQAACSGFLYALETATALLNQNPSYKNILVIGAEKLSSIMDWEDRSTCVLFGDGAGAVIISKTQIPNIGIIHSILQSEGSKSDILKQPGGGSACPASQESILARQHFLKMDGREVFKHAVRLTSEICESLLNKTQLTPQDIDLVIPHQANLRILEVLSHRIGIPMNRFYINLNRYGNTSAASIPIALKEAYDKGLIKSGDNILLVAFGAGLTWASTLVKWH